MTWSCNVCRLFWFQCQKIVLTKGVERIEKAEIRVAIGKLKDKWKKFFKSRHIKNTWCTSCLDSFSGSPLSSERCNVAGSNKFYSMHMGKILFLRSQIVIVYLHFISWNILHFWVLSWLELLKKKKSWNHTRM